MLKNTFLTAAYDKPDFTTIDEIIARIITQGLGLAFDHLKLFYRRITKKHLVSSMGGLQLSLIINPILMLSFLASDFTNSAKFVAYLGLPLYILQQNISVASLVHLFETMNADSDTNEPAGTTHDEQGQGQGSKSKSAKPSSKKSTLLSSFELNTLSFVYQLASRAFIKPLRAMNGLIADVVKVLLTANGLLNVYKVDLLLSDAERV